MIRFMALTSLLFFQSAYAIGGWADWWKTPEQQALDLYESDNADALLEVAPDENWQGIAQFQSGNFETAAHTFRNQQQKLLENGDEAKARTSAYNQALSDIMSGQYQQAISSLDELLDTAPDYPDAKHNRDIAQKLLELEQQEQQQNSEQSDSGESADPDNSDSQSSDSSEGGEQGDDSSQQSESEEGQQSEGSSDSDTDESESQSEEQQQQEAQEASDALNAEAEQQAKEQSEEQGENESMQFVENDEPLTESEQATEQMLRRIPDDPRGLLRRKLEQSHLSEYPEVRDAAKPW